MASLSEANKFLIYLGAASLAKYAAFQWGPLLAKYLGHRVQVGTVAGLVVHPVKSMGGIHLNEVLCTQLGLRSMDGIFDRHFVVVDCDEPVARTSKLTTILASVKAEIVDGYVRLSAKTEPELGSITLNHDDIIKNGKVVEGVLVSGMEVAGLDCGSEAGAFLDGLLGKSGHRLLFCAPDTRRRPVRQSTVKYKDWTINTAKDEDELGYQDCTQVMLMAQESLADLNSRLDFDASIDRFRPNIIAKDVALFDEDTWSEVYIGDCKFSLIKLCGRCLMTCVDPETGVAHSKEEPLKTLRSYRMLVPGFGPCLGINLIVDQPGTLRVGDPIYAVRGPVKIKP